MKTYIKIPFCLLCLFLFTSGLQAQIDRSQPPVDGNVPELVFEDIQEFTLRNGLTVIVAESSKVPAAYATLSFDSPPVFEDKPGTTALLSSLLGKGTQLTNKESFIEELDFMGASLQYSGTVAIGNSLSMHFDRLLELLAEATLQPLFDPDELEKNRQQMAQNIQMSDIQPTAILQRAQKVLAYGNNHPLGRPITAGSMEAITLADIKQMYDRQFRPNNAYLVIIGDVDFKHIRKKIKKLFGSWTPREESSTSMPMVNQLGSSQINFIDLPDSSQSNISIFNPVYLKLGDPDFIPVQLANAILGDGPSSRLFKSIREEKKYTYGVYSQIGHSKHTSSLFQMTTSVRNEVTDSTIVALLNEGYKMLEEPVSKEELANAKAKFIGDFIMSMGEPSTFAQFAINTAAFDLPDDYYTQYLSKVEAVTPDDIQRVAKKYFNVFKARILVVGNQDEVLEALQDDMYFLGSALNVHHYDKEGNKLVFQEPKIPIPDEITPKNVIENYLDAIGGNSVLNTVQDLVLDYRKIGGMEFSLPEDKEKEIQWATPKDTTYDVRHMRTRDKYARIDQTLDFMSDKVVITKDVSFMKTLRDNSITMIENEEVKEQLYNIGIFPEMGMLRELGTDMKLEPYLKKIGREQAYGLRKETKQGYIIWYYSTSSGLKLKKVEFVDISKMGAQMQGTHTTVYNYKQYSSFGNLKFPTLIQERSGSSTGLARMGSGIFDLKLVDVKINSGLTDTDFE